MKTNNEIQKPILVKIADQLLKDQQELDHLAVQLSLGKVEAKEEFEKMKSKMKTSLHEFKVELSSEVNEEYVSLENSLSELEEKLEEGEAKTKEIFLTQKKNILERLEIVKIEIENNPSVVKTAHFFTSVVLKTKLQLEILEKNFEESKKEVTKEYNLEMIKAHEKIVLTIVKIKEKQEEANIKWENFKEEINISYEHLKKAIQAL